MADRIIKPDSGDQLILQDDGGGDALTIETDQDVKINAGNVVIGTAGKGIDFSQSQTPAAGMTAEILDSYEEGEWTAGVSVDAGAMSLESGFNTGSYVKIGNLCTVQGMFKVDATTASLGYIGITGAPFAAAALTQAADYSVGSCFVVGASSTIGGGVVAWVEATTTPFALRENGTTGVGNTLTSHFDAGTEFTLCITYRTA